MNDSNGSNKQEGTKRRSMRVIWVILVLLVVVAVIAGGYFYIQSSETQHLEEARTAISLSEWETAASSLDQVLDTQPEFIRQHDNEAIALRGFVHYQMNDLPAALADIDHALAEDSNLVELLAYRANIHFEQNDHELAFKDGESTLEQSELLPAHLLASLHANQAIINYELGDDQAVVENVEVALPLSEYLEDDKLAKLYVLRAVSAYDQGDIASSLEDTRSALSFDVVLADEMLATLLGNQAEMLFEQEQYERAMDASNQVFEYADLLPAETMSNLYRERAQYFYDQDNLAAAIGEAQKAVSYGEDLPILHALQALQSFQLFAAKEAMDEAEAALVLDDRNVLAHRIRGTLLAQQGDAQTALEHLERAKDLAPGDVDTLSMSVQAHLELDDLEAAEADLAKVVELAPNSPQTLWAQAMVHEHNYEFEAARSALDQAIALDGNRPEFYTLRSQTYQKADEMADAKADLESALAINPDFLEAQADIVANRASSFDFDNFETDIQGLIAKHPKWSKGHEMLAEYHIWVTEDFDQATVHTEKVIELNPGLASGHVLQGYVHLLQDDDEQALEAFERAREANSSSIFVLGGLADYYGANNEPERALANIEEMSSLSPEASPPRVAEAQVYLSMGDLDNAWISINKLLADDPENPYALTTRSDINYQVGDFQEAMIDVSRAIDNYPHYAFALLKRAGIYYAQGDLELARQFANQALEEDPSLALAHGVLSDIALVDNDLEESLVQINLMIEEIPDWTQGYLNQGIVNSSLGHYDEAVTSYSTGIEVASDDNDMIGLLTFQRALVNFTLGDKEQGLADLQAVLELTSNVELLNNTENFLAYPSSIPVVADGRTLVEDEIQRYSISYSQDWDRTEDDPENGHVLSLWLEEGNAVASVDVFITEWPYDLNAFAEAIVDAFYDPGSFTSLALDDVDFAGGNGLVRQYELVGDDGTLVDGRHYYAVQDGRAAFIMIEVIQGDYDRFAEELEAVAASFAFLP